MKLRPSNFYLFFLIFAMANEAQADAISCDNLSAEQRAIAISNGVNLEEVCKTDLGKGQSSKVIEKVEIPSRSTISSSKGISTIVGTPSVSGVGIVAKAEELRPFGYDLFAGSPNTFAPVTSFPVSPDYILGPGDSLDILFYGKLNQNISATINNEGYVTIADLGPISIAGLSFIEAKNLIKERVNTQMIGVNLTITMGELRSIEVFILGEAFKPGSYTISSLSTITHALIVSGGLNDLGSLRNIKLFRNGKLVSTLDLYDLLLKGDISGDIRLQSSDVIFIPVVGPMASINGQVRKPALYELKNENSIEDLINLAGGIGPKGFPKVSTMTRIGADGFLKIFDLDLSTEADLQTRLKSGDDIFVGSIIPKINNKVSISGNVYYPRSFDWKPNMKLSDLITGVDQFDDRIDLDYSLLIRKVGKDKEQLKQNIVEVKLLNLRELIINKNKSYDVILEPSDEVMIFSNSSLRVKQLESLIGRLKNQSTYKELPKTVSINGQVKFPGEYPLIPNMGLKELIEHSGGLKESTYTISAEISRVDLNNPNKAKLEIIKVGSITSLRKEDYKLSPLDSVYINLLPDFGEIDSIVLQGEVVLPGIYPVSKGYNLSEVIRRAGGFKPTADIKAAIFTREYLREKERQKIEEYREIVADEAFVSLRDKDSSESRLSLFASQVNRLQAIGRMVIPLEEIMSSPSLDIEVLNGDRLFIPRKKPDVSIMGEVYFPSTHLYEKGLSYSDYIEKAGGIKGTGYAKNIFIIRSSGDIIRPGRVHWLSKNKIYPGDTIIVPIDTREVKRFPLELITEMSTIIYQLTLGAAALESLRDN